MVKIYCYVVAIYELSEDFEWLLDNFKSKEDIAKGAPKIDIDRPDFETIDITSSDKENELEEDEIVEIIEVNEITIACTNRRADNQLLHYLGKCRDRSIGTQTRVCSRLQRGSKVSC